MLAKDDENNLRPPRMPKACYHGLPPLQCSESDPDTRYRCPSGDDIKYRMTRVAIDAVDLHILENGTAFQIWVSDIFTTLYTYSFSSFNELQIPMSTYF